MHEKNEQTTTFTCSEGDKIVTHAVNSKSPRSLADQEEDVFDRINEDDMRIT